MGVLPRPTPLSCTSRSPNPFPRAHCGSRPIPGRKTCDGTGAWRAGAFARSPSLFLVILGRAMEGSPRTGRQRRGVDARLRRRPRRRVRRALRAAQGRAFTVNLLRHCRNAGIADETVSGCLDECDSRPARAYVPTAKFTTWLYTLAHNRLVDHLAARRGRPKFRVRSIMRMPMATPTRGGWVEAITGRAQTRRNPSRAHKCASSGPNWHAALLAAIAARPTRRFSCSNTKADCRSPKSRR